MTASDLAHLITVAEQLSLEPSPAQAVELNQQVLQLDSMNAAAYAWRTTSGICPCERSISPKPLCQRRIYNPSMERRYGSWACHISSKSTLISAGEQTAAVSGSSISA